MLEKILTGTELGEQVCFSTGALMEAAAQPVQQEYRLGTRTSGFQCHSKGLPLSFKVFAGAVLLL